MKNTHHLFRNTLITLLAILFWSGNAIASSSYLTAFNSLYPTSTTGTTASWSSSGARCNICHSSGAGTNINAYGNAWALRHNLGRTPAQAFMDIEGDDSDGSGVTNLREITANTQPGWKLGATNTIYDLNLPGTVVLSNQNPPTTLIGLADPAAPVPSSAVSRKTHGAAGDFDVPLPLVPVGGAVGIEPRNGPAHTMVVTFASPVTVAGATVTTGTGAASLSVAGSVVTVNLTGVADLQRIAVTLSNVDAGGAAVGNVTVPMGLLSGDTAGTGSGQVNGTDVSATKAAASVGTVTGSTFRSDVNFGGLINGTDVAIVKSRSGNALPP